MQTALHSERMPATAGQRLSADQIFHAVTPVGTTTTDKDFKTAIRHARFGAVQVSSLAVSPYSPDRISQLIRRSDHGTLLLILVRSGHSTVIQDGREAPLRDSDLTLIDTSRPYSVRTIPGDTFGVVLADFPRSLLPLPTPELRRLIATTLSGRTGIGTLLRDFLVRLTTDSDHYHVCDAPCLATILIDLLTALLARHVNTDTSSPRRGRHHPDQHTLLVRIHAYIQRHLADPDLSPAKIATAHNISTRTLHRLFQAHNSAAAAWIRNRRLDRTQRDLADPALRNQPIYAIAARWGFSDAAHFTRTFRAATGLTPYSYRQRHQRSAENPPSL